jgi:hypothetical protein
MKQIKMLEFLKEHLSHSHVIDEVLEVKLLDYDTELGLAGEVYSVKLVEIRPDISSLSHHARIKIERNCMVNAIEYNSWYRKKQIIKFID